MADSAFWREQQAKFERLAQEWPPIEAHWDAESGRWWFWAPGDMSQELQDALAADLRQAAVGLPNAAGYKEPACAILDTITQVAEQRGWECVAVTGSVRYTELEWQAGGKDGQPRAQIRREHPEWEKVSRTRQGGLRRRCAWDAIYALTKSGKVRRLSARELKGKSSDDLRQYFHDVNKLAIAPLLPSVALFCKLRAAGVIADDAAPAAAQRAEPSATIESQKAERKALRDGYRVECKRAGVRLTDEMIAQAASPRWHSRSQIQKWLKCDPEYDGEPDRLIRKVFRDKPHLRSHSA